MTNDIIEISRQNPLWATGRRKTATVRVRVVPGEGRMVINGKTLDGYFGGHHRQKSAVLAPLKATGQSFGKLDVFVTASGGGVTGQAESIRLGISRALVSMDPKFRAPLRKEGFLTRDPRAVERKKYGQPKARRRFQHSKR